MTVKRYRINSSYTPEQYEEIKKMAHRENTDMATLQRKATLQYLNGTLTENNLDYIAPIIREQLKAVMKPSIERLASLSAKTCVQAGAAAYLSAEALVKFVPEREREDFRKSYEAARKKAVQYTKNRSDLYEEDFD